MCGKCLHLVNSSVASGLLDHRHGHTQKLTANSLALARSLARALSLSAPWSRRSHAPGVPRCETSSVHWTGVLRKVFSHTGVGIRASASVDTAVVGPAAQPPHVGA